MTDSSSEFSSDSDTDPESGAGAPASKKAKKSKDKPKEEKPAAATANGKFIVMEMALYFLNSVFCNYKDAWIDNSTSLLSDIISKIKKIMCCMFNVLCIFKLFNVKKVLLSSLPYLLV